MATCPKCGAVSSGFFCSCGQDLRAQYPQFAAQLAVKKVKEQAAAAAHRGQGTAEVADILAELGLEHHSTRFEQERLDLSALLACSDADLQSLGMAALGERKRLLAWISGRAQSTAAVDAIPPRVEERAFSGAFRIPLKRVAFGLIVLFPLLRAVRGLAFGYSMVGVGDDLVQRIVGHHFGGGLVYGVIAGVFTTVALAVLVGRVAGELPARTLIGRVAIAGVVGAGATWALGDGAFRGIPAGICADVVGAFLLLLLPRTWSSYAGVVVACVGVEVASWTVPWLFEHHDVGFAAALPSVAVRGALVGANGFWGLAAAHVGFLGYARWSLAEAVAPVPPSVNVAGALRRLVDGTTRLTLGGAVSSTAAATSRAVTVTTPVTSSKCAFCAEAIPVGTVRCPFCAEVLDRGAP